MTNIEIQKLSDLKPDQANANRGTERGRAMLESSLRQWGAGRSILLDKEGRIIAGNKTFEEAGQIGLEDVVIVRTQGDKLVAVLREDLDLADDATGARELAYADNRVGQVSLDWQPEQILADLDSGLDLAQFWSEGELNAILAGLNTEPKQDPGPQVDKAAQLAEKWGTQTGQVWALGEHRLAVGDCTDKAVAEAVMRGERANLCFTSPPYNRGTTTGGGFPKQGGMWQNAELANGYNSFADNMPTTKYRDWQKKLLLDWWEVITEDGAIYYNHRPRVQDGLFETPLDWNPGLPIRQIVIWYSGAGINFAPTHYRVSCEWIVIYAKPNFRLTSKSISGLGDVWKFGAEQNPSHPAPFPVELPKTAIETTNSNIVYDPFLGSGTTLVACEQLKRKCRAIEIDPGYSAVALQRWADLTGQEPTLLSE